MLGKEKISMMGRKMMAMPSAPLGWSDLARACSTRVASGLVREENGGLPAEELAVQHAADERGGQGDEHAVDDEPAGCPRPCSWRHGAGGGG